MLWTACARPRDERQRRGRWGLVPPYPAAPQDIERVKPIRHLGTAALLLLAMVAAVAHAATPLRVIYPLPESRRDARADYPLELLRLALDRSGVPYRLEPSTVPMQQARSMQQLADGQDLDILWTVATRARERDLLPIRIPIDRGLIGWRVLLIRNGEQARMGTVDVLPGLADLWAGQGHDWPDLQILRANGLKVVASPTYEGLFGMLRDQHIDYFPRAATEAVRELDRHPGMGLAIERHLLLHYPSALYYFVRPGNRLLADAVTHGLERAIADGSMDALFRHAYGSLDQELGLARRRVIELANPEFPGDAPTGRTGLWFRPGESQ